VRPFRVLHGSGHWALTGVRGAPAGIPGGSCRSTRRVLGVPPVGGALSRHTSDRPYFPRCSSSMESFTFRRSETGSSFPGGLVSLECEGVVYESKRKKPW
jgi:hypothetical protein